jgi:hypothetical protein
MGAHHRAELQRLELYRMHVEEYRRWLGEMPDVCEALGNLKAMADGGTFTSEFYGDKAYPMHIVNLRDDLRISRRGWKVQA